MQEIREEESHFQMWALKHREVKQFTYVHTANEQQRQDGNPGILVMLIKHSLQWFLPSVYFVPNAHPACSPGELDWLPA